MLASLDDVKIELGISLADATQDPRLTRFIEAASEFIEAYCRRKFHAADDLVEEHPRDTVVQVRRPPIREITPPEGYVVDSASAGLLRASPALNPFLGSTADSRGTVEVTYDGGFDAIPAAIQDACIRLVVLRVQSVTALDAGVVSASEGAVSVGFAASAITSNQDGLSKSLQGILNRYRLPAA